MSEQGTQSSITIGTLMSDRGVPGPPGFVALIRETLSLVAKHPLTLIAIPIGGPFLARLLVDASHWAIFGDDVSLSGTLVELHGSIAIMLADGLATSIQLQSLADLDQGRRRTVQRTLRSGLRCWLRVLYVRLLVELLGVLGLLLLVVPGIFLWSFYSITAPVAVFEKRGALASFARTDQLLRGSWWRTVKYTSGLLLLGLPVTIAPFFFETPASCLGNVIFWNLQCLPGLAMSCLYWNFVTLHYQSLRQQERFPCSC